MDEHPWVQNAVEAPAPGDDLAPSAFADWITEDVVQRLYAARQDIADVVTAIPCPDAGAELVRDRLLLVIGNLRGLATRLRASTGGSTAAPNVARVAASVAQECESARMLIAQCSATLCGDLRIRVESERLARDGTRLQRVSSAMGA